MTAPLFWKLLTAACLIWYGSITVYVVIRGARDIQEMLRRLKSGREADETKN
jgi:hypothetical protein